MSKTSKQKLPHFEIPPVVEVVCGVMFDPLEALKAPYLGAFWAKVRRRFPVYQDMPPLGRVIERFGGEPQETSIEIRDIPPIPRAWFLQESGNGLIQIQKDWMLFNWKRVKPEDRYPRYRIVQRDFSKYYKLFSSFVSENKLGCIKPRQYQLQYVNHIMVEEGWTSLDDVGALFPDFVWRPKRERSEKFLPAPEAINWQTSFALPNETGRLHVHIRSAKLTDDQKPLIRLDLLARGMSERKSEAGMWKWFDTAHEWIVRGFADITEPKVQSDIWRRIQ